MRLGNAKSHYTRTTPGPHQSMVYIWEPVWSISIYSFKQKDTKYYQSIDGIFYLLFCFFVFWPPLSFQKAGADSDNSHTLTGLHFVRLYWTKVMRSRLTKTKWSEEQKERERERESRRRIEFNIFLIRNAYGFAWHSPSDERASIRGGDFWKSSVGSLLPRVGQFEVNPGPSQFSLRRSLSSLSVIASIIP